MCLRHDLEVFHCITRTSTYLLDAVYCRRDPGLHKQTAQNNDHSRRALLENTISDCIQKSPSPSGRILNSCSLTLISIYVQAPSRLFRYICLPYCLIIVYLTFPFDISIGYKLHTKQAKYNLLLVSYVFFDVVSILSFGPGSVFNLIPFMLSTVRHSEYLIVLTLLQCHSITAIYCYHS